MRSVTKKPWGTTRKLEANPFVELHRIRAEPGHHCSWHRHEAKTNAFYVVKGKLTIEWREGTGEIERAELVPGDFMAVPAGVLHRFVTLEHSVEALEVYWPAECSEEDIVRIDESGPNNDGGAAAPR